MSAAIMGSASRLKQLADEIALAKFATLELPNYDQLRRGMQYLDNFTAAGLRFLKSAREARGDFKATESGVRLNGHETQSK